MLIGAFPIGQKAINTFGEECITMEAQSGHNPATHPKDATDPQGNAACVRYRVVGRGEDQHWCMIRTWQTRAAKASAS